jgi:hypothetical protein
MPLVVRVGACECVVCSEVIIDGTTTLPGAGVLWMEQQQHHTEHISLIIIFKYLNIRM